MMMQLIVVEVWKTFAMMIDFAFVLLMISALTFILLLNL